MFRAKNLYTIAILAVILGITTFPMGTEDTNEYIYHIYMEDGTMVKYTTAKWLTPLGNCIDEIGISPDYVVEMTKNENGEIVDNQLDKAVEILTYTSSSIIEE